MSAYYNEIDRKSAAWLRELIKAGIIAPGDVDERSIEDVRPTELSGYTQCHFFAGIGVWSYSLRQSGWPDSRPVWTGSCPCQPFSTAGKRGGFADERHLWPAWYHLISQCRPITVFGEQVASKDGLAWLDIVQSDMEGAGYTVGTNDLCAAGFGAPHIRQRLYFVADSERWASERQRFFVGGTQEAVEVATQERQRIWNDTGNGINISDMADAKSSRSRPRLCDSEQREQRWLQSSNSGATNGFWADADWIPCRDGKARPVEPAFKQMVDGIACAMVYMRNKGNDQKINEAIYEAATNPDTREILRTMQQSDVPESVWLSLGGQIGFLEATLLLAFLLEYEGKLGDFVDSEAEGGQQACRIFLRNMQFRDEFARSSQGSGLPQQLTGKLANTLRELSQENSLELLATLNGFPLAQKYPARVMRLHGYGNAIVAPVAIEFIKAAMEELEAR